ncbi:MAG: ribosome-binding factor A [Candidatus Falkowbacteria bacterium]
MSRRIEQVNEILRSELANLIAGNLEVDGCLVTVISVKTSPDLRHARVSVSVLPEHLTGTALQAVRKNNSLFSRVLKKKLNLKLIPKFDWVIDANERYAAEINRAIDEMKNA